MFVGLVKFSLLVGFLVFLFNVIVATNDIQQGSPEIREFGQSVERAKSQLDAIEARKHSK